MLRTAFVTTILAITLSLAPLPAAAAARARRVAATHTTHLRWYGSGEFAPRRYWHWDGQPLLPEPWTARPIYWQSLNPPRVPANMWARNWHLFGYRCRRPGHCR